MVGIMPPPDELDRDRFYTSSADEWDDSADYELEPPDAEVLAAEERRAAEAIEEIQNSVDIDEVYRDAERDVGREVLEKWARDFRFQFQVKHLLIATAVIAILLTLAKLQILGTTLMLLFFAAIVGLYCYVNWQEKKHHEEADRRRHEMYARQRKRFEPTTAPAPGAAPQPSPEAASERVARPFRFQFSLWEMLIAITTAAVVLGFIQFMGGPGPAATMFGFIALAGLGIHALGYEPPGILVLGWWLLLVLYVVLTIVAFVFSAF